ncbi:MAG: alkaline phosphatase [Bacteroidota bacterium]
MKKLSLYLFILLGILFYVQPSCAQNSGKIKYVFLFIGDGMGTNQVFLTEKFNDATHTDPLIFLNSNWSFGLSRTECADSNRITDSGAGGTAIACGQRTSFSAIGEYKGNALESIAEYLHNKKNFRVGLITTVPINDATPACFYGHEPSRYNYDNLTNDMIASHFEYFAGGGFHYGNKDTTKTIYRNLNSVINKLKENNFQLVLNKQQEMGLGYTAKFPVFELDTAIRNRMLKIKNITGEDQDALPYVLDFPEYTMQLAKYTETAQSLLMNNTGFFLMVEGGKIDWACHGNDALTAIYELNAFNQAIKKAYEFYLQHPDNTLILITADHETGGMSQGEGYNKNNQNKSNGYALFIKKLLKQKNSSLFMNADSIKQIQQEALIGWTTSEHTSAPVGVWAIGQGSQSFSGIMKNSELKEKILKLIE